MLNWSKLIPYKSDCRKSFEELCYQIAREEFDNKGIFTSIDDSGGGDGVEFYLTLPNGDEWGWQAKFFDGNGRLNESNRKNQIKTSLKTAIKKHPNLKKWFLCLKTNLTPNQKRKNSMIQGELTWFNNTLIKEIPADMDLKLLHWGESDFNNFLRKYPNIHNYFFSENLLTQNWFKNRYKIDVKKSQIKAKYESRIHISTEVNDTVNKLFLGKKLLKILEKEMKKQQVLMYSDEYDNALSKLFSENVETEYKNIQLEFRNILQDKFNLIKDGIQRLEVLKQLALDKDEINLKIRIKEFEAYIKTLWDFYYEYAKLIDSELCKPIRPIRKEYRDGSLATFKKESENFINKIFNLFKKRSKKEYKMPQQVKESEEIEHENRRRHKAKAILFGPLYSLKDYAIPSLESSFRVFELIGQNELHISGDAGMGKTHVSFNIYEDKIVNQKQPVIFIFAKDIVTNQALEEQLRNELSIPTDWSFDDFLGALEIAARINKNSIPIIIDGLNESTFWDSLWKTGLEKLILKIKEKYPHLIIITTYRTSYEDQLFHKKYFYDKTNKNWWKKKVSVRGFEGLTKEAIEKYFNFYKIKLNIYSNAIKNFKHPLYLKLFCETKNPNRKNVVSVSFQNEDLFEVFDKYIQKSNENITSSLRKLNPRYDNSFTKDKLLKLGGLIWDNNLRGISRSNKLFSNEELDSFLGENLLVFRDWNSEQNREEIQFTYDLLGGYIISKYLIEKYKESYPLLTVQSNNILIKLSKVGLEFIMPESGTKLLGELFMNINKKVGGRNPLLKFVKSNEFREKLLKTQHPLFNDILRTISILLIKETKIFLFDVLKDEKAKKYSMESLFEINTKYIRENEQLTKEFLKNEFLNANNKYFLFNLAKNVELDMNHPVNFNFWSDLLNSLSIIERDMSWSEYVRKNDSKYGNSYFTDFVKKFEDVCKEKSKLPSRANIAAKKVMWILTTNIRKLRDEATKALYYYARKDPRGFLKLLEYSLSINDPYVPERIMAVAYGYAMFIQNNKSQPTQDEIRQLSEYGKLIYKNIFDLKAKHHTTHILMRDYAKRFLDISLKYNSNLLSQSEKELLIYPLKKYPHIKWGQSDDQDKGKYREGNAPIHMDFRNYTIGRLIKDRGNYQDEHPEYKQILSNIYWRIYQLGYSLEKFEYIDKQIANKRNYSRSEDSNKIDRYGKKYSWIAYYEMAGYRSDLGLLKGWNDEDVFRISDVDIDPSFPMSLKKIEFKKFILKDSLLSCDNAIEKWINVSPFIVTDKIVKIKDLFDIGKDIEWVLIKGTISQKDKENQTEDVYISINGVIVDNDEIKKIETLLDKDYSFQNIDSPSDYYLYEGEFIWSDLMPYNEKSEEIINTIKDKKVIDSKEINFVHSVFMNSWEGHSNEVNDGGSTIVPSKQISEYLKLKLKPQSSDLYDEKDRLGSTTFIDGEYWENRLTLTYIRKDLIQKYLSDKNKNLVWFKWGEKRFFKNGISGIRDSKEDNKFKTFYNIEKFDK